MFLKILTGTLVVLILLVVAFVLIARKTSSSVYVERTLPAPVDKVWKLWNDPEAMKKWWGPKGYTAPVVKNDFRVHGAFLLSMRSPNGEMHWNAGTYREIVDRQRIVSAMSFSDEHGKVIPGSEVPVPGEWPDDITVTVEFRETNGGTTVAVTEAGIPLIMKFFATLGWQQQFDKLEALLAGGAS